MSRKIICADSLKWLQQQRNGSLPNIVTGICDHDEMNGYTMEQYQDFFVNVAELIFQKQMPGCYAIFIQTDRKWQRQWLDKSYILTRIARNNGYKTIWHKIVLHRPVNSTHLQRPTYAHMLCYSRDGTTGSATPDVLDDKGGKLYSNGTPLNAAKTALDFIARYSKVKDVLDPFVGQGTIAAIGESLGLNVIGIDIDSEQCRKAKTLNIKISNISNKK